MKISLELLKAKKDEIEKEMEFIAEEFRDFLNEKMSKLILLKII